MVVCDTLRVQSNIVFQDQKDSITKINRNAELYTFSYRSLDKIETLVLYK
jgi:hypothetical protein